MPRVPTEALSTDFVPVTAVLVARQTVASFTNRVVFDLPARTLFPGETFAVPVTDMPRILRRLFP
jgi:hypothetical protein